MHGYYSKDRRKYGEISYERKYLLDPKYMTKRDMRHYYRYYNMTRNRCQCKKIIIIIFSICFFFYIFIDYNLKTKIIQLRDRFDFIARIDTNYSGKQAYFVDTPGCRMPYFPITDENIIQYMSRPKGSTCDKPLTRTSDIGATIIINMNEQEILKNYNLRDLKNIHCYYREIKRLNDIKNKYLEYIPFKFEINGSTNVLPGIEFINVVCKDIEKGIFYNDFHFFVLNKQNISNYEIRKTTNSKNSYENNSSSLKHKKHKNHLNTTVPKITAKKPANSGERISVMLLGINSVSHLNFLRQMQQTANFIHQNLSHIEFWGYNKVGDNSYPNVVPLLTGLDESELSIACLEPVKRTKFDKCHFIWKRYKEAGYRTVFAEDVAESGLFNYFLPGFEVQPTDYYFRPIMLEMERYIADKQERNANTCLGGRQSAAVLLEYIRKLIPHLKVGDFFSLFWSVTLTHDDFNSPMLVDEHFLQLFKLFDESGILNKTVIFFMSDHGMRYGSFRATYQGMMEERQPLLIALFPIWFRQKYSTAIKNMELNVNRLSTHFDMYATLLDLLDLNGIDEMNLKTRSANMAEADTLPRSISLFLPIPASRTCYNAGIASSWCLCHQLEELPTNDARVQRAARYLIKIINDRLKAHPQCRILYLNSILKAMIAAPHHKIVKDVTNDYSIDITVRIEAKPGFALFESTIRMSLYTIGLTGSISRINLYSSQSYCITVRELKMFCYCHR